MANKPHLACDIDLAKVKYPCIVMPKIDGVRGCNFDGKFTGRSLKFHANLYTTKTFTRKILIGMDGELTCGDITASDLCRTTTSVLNTVEGTPLCVWNVFDLLDEVNIKLPYWQRLVNLDAKVRELNDPLVQRVPYVVCYNLQQLLEVERTWLLAGYEGLIVRDPDGLHKDGRCTVNEGAYLRLKRFIDFEFIASQVIEGTTNNNPKTTNALGKSTRSSHKANLAPNGMIGSIIGHSLSNVYCMVTDKLLIPKGAEVEVGAGCLSHSQRKHYFDNQVEFFKLIHKAQFFPFGMKDKLRFPTWINFRMESDLS